MTFSDYVSTFKVTRSPKFRNDYIDHSVDRERRPEDKRKTIWDNPLLEWINLYPSTYSPYERRFLIKFDISVLVFLQLTFFTKYLDNTNVSAAYVIGMKEDLNWIPNELNIWNTCYTVGYAVCQIPLTLLIVKPAFSRYLIIVSELLWGIFTLANTWVKTSEQVMALRVLVGIAEACQFPAAYVIFSSWLTPKELLKRAGAYGAFAVLGSALSGLISTGAYNHLSGVAGLEGWRWLFLIEGLITIITVLYGFFLFPGIPSHTKKFGLFSEDDMTFARKRLEGQVANPTKFTWRSVKAAFTTWQLPVLTLLWTLHHSCFYSSGAKLYMKSRTDLYTSGQVTETDAYMYFTGIPSAVLIAPLAVWLGKLPVVTFVMITAYYASAVLIKFDVTNNTLLLSAFYVQRVFLDGLSQLFYGWAATLNNDDIEKKAIVLSFMQACVYATNSWVIPIQYNTKWSPKFRPGYTANIVLVFATHLFFMITWVLSRWDRQIIPKYSGHRHLGANGKMEGYDDDTDSGSENVITENETVSLKQ